MIDVKWCRGSKNVNFVKEWGKTFQSKGGLRLPCRLWKRVPTAKIIIFTHFRFKDPYYTCLDHSCKESCLSVTITNTMQFCFEQWVLLLNWKLSTNWGPDGTTFLSHVYFEPVGILTMPPLPGVVLFTTFIFFKEKLWAVGFSWQKNEIVFRGLPQPERTSLFLWFRIYITSQRTILLTVFSIDGLKQNAGSVLTPFSNIVLYALSNGTLGFAFHGSFNNHLI